MSSAVFKFLIRPGAALAQSVCAPRGQLTSARPRLFLRPCNGFSSGLFLALTVLASAGNAASASRTPHFDIAMTVDDLTGNGQLPPERSRLDVAQKYLTTLRRFHVAEAYGFVNASKLDRDPDGAAVLAAWRQAGYPLGNHGYAHLNLAGAPSLDAWKSDVEKGEAAIAERMQGADWHYYRYPNLSAAGNTPRHGPALSFLQARAYRIADVSVSFDDWAYSDAYARCLRKGDRAAIAAMKKQYFKGVDAAILRMRALSNAVYGRMVPQVLLTHLSAWSSDTLPGVMRRLQAAGARYVTLSEAQKDPAYAEMGLLAADGMLMERSARERGIDLAGIPPRNPLENLNHLCR